MIAFPAVLRVLDGEDVMTTNTRWLFRLGTFLIVVGWTKAGLADPEQLQKRVGGVHVPFVANHGQTDPAVAFYAPTFAGTVYVTEKGEIVYSLPAPSENRGSSRVGKAARAGWTLTEIPVRGRARVAAERPAQARVNYFIGSDPGRWRSGIPTYEGVGLGEVWPGVGLSLRAYGDNVEKLFTVRPGAQPSRIRMRIAGAKSLRVNEAGALVASTDLGEVTFTPPLAYQEQDGLRRAVTVAYRARGREYGFSLGSHDPALPVVIDPLLQATYLGGSGDDYGYGLAIHPTSGDVYIAGLTLSTNFPGTAGGAQPASEGGSDAFVACLNATLTTLIQATYLGGSGDDIGYALAIHPTSGEVFVTGFTGSTDFPGTTGGAQPANGGGVLSDGFVARLNSMLTTLIQATYLGGSGSEFSRALAIHPTSGEVFVTGFTHSTNFPSTAGGAQPANGGGGDAFVARINGALTTLLQATYLGGSVIDPGFNDNEEFGVALSIHPTSGEVYVAGRTNSPDFPGTTGGAQPFYGEQSARTSFVARLNTTLTTLSQATYLGGTGDKGAGNALAIHPTSGEVFVAGETASTDFPGTAGGAQPVKGGGFRDGYVARLNAALTTLNQATYLGGSWGGNIDESGDDVALALAIHPTSGEVFVAGRTVSTDFPGTAGGAQPAFGGFGPAFLGGGDAFVARLNATLTTLSQATYLGGGGEDWGYAVAIHPTSGDVFVAGSTLSTDFPGMAGGAQPASGGEADAFVARFTADLEAILAPAALLVDPTATAGSDGDGVFEPGETVPVIPSWENLSDSPQTPNGQASGFTGPPDATYTILNDTVSYGTISPGGVGIPGGAYSMSISAPATRPATHWDATFTETLDVQYVLPYRHILHVGDSFPDVPRSNIFYAHIENVLHQGITAGCGGGNYCPDSSVTRAQMAVFLLKSKHGSTYLPPGCAGVFPDVPCPSLFADWIEQLAAEGITGGCGSGNYCPDNPVTRAQMSAFLLKAEHGPSYVPPTCAGIFGDVTCPSLFADWIEQLAAEQITGGCGGSNYCPANANTRGQMAVFLVKTFELRLYGP
jgi:hypothetical protein